MSVSTEFFACYLTHSQRNRVFLLLALALFLTSCKSSKPASSFPEPSVSDFIILQLNDVYEISPLQGGKVGGLARVATVRKQLLQECPVVITVLAGDFLSPSLTGSLSTGTGDEKEKIAGKHMIETLNALPLDYATFGNHEFDIGEAALVKRISESEFIYTSANVNHLVGGKAATFFRKGMAVSQFEFISIPLPNDSILRLGLIGVTLVFNQVDFVEYREPIQSFANIYASIERSCDVVIGLTHLDRHQDQQLAEAVPALPLIMGGHEHDDTLFTIGTTVIAKANANAKTVYIHRCKWKNGSLEVKSELQHITDAIESDSTVQAAIDKWDKIATEAVGAMGYDAKQEIGHTANAWDGRESVIRHRQTNFGKLITEAMLYADTTAVAAIINSGTIRLDDHLHGKIHQSDILRSLPFGGPIVHAEMMGTDLVRVLETGTTSNSGTGGYLQYSGVEKHNSQWLANGAAIAPAEKYAVVMPQFLAQGKESNLGFLATLDIYSPIILTGVNGEEKNDIRDVVITYIRR